MNELIKPKAIIYVRVSSDEQVDGTSLDFQEKECKRFCEKNGWEVFDIFREEGETAKDLSLHNRKELLRAMETCRKNKDKIKAFVVLRVNRFARNTEDHFAIRKILSDYGTKLYSATELIGDKPQEKVFETMAAAFSEYENAIRKQQSTDGMSQKINQGLYPWNSPLGYLSGHFKKRDLKKTEADEPDSVRFPIIKRLFITCLEEKISSNVELSKLANQWGLTTRKGKKIYPQKIDSIFSNKFYAGIIFNPFTGKEVEGKHIKMIDVDEFNQIQLIRKGKIKTLFPKRFRDNPDFPLAKDVKCSVCGSGLSGSHPRGNGGIYSYYHCHNKRCQMYGKNISQFKLHEDFIKLLSNITPKSDFLNLFEEIVVDVWKNKGALLEDATKRYEADIAELKQKKYDYVEMMRKEKISEDLGKEMIEKVDCEIAAKNISINECSIDKLDIEAAVIYATKFISDLPRTWNDLNIENKKRFQKLVLPEGITYDKKLGFGTAQLGLIYNINRQVNGDKNDLVPQTGLEPVTFNLKGCCSTN